MRRLLFTAGGGAGNEAILRLWGGRYDLYFADADANAICPAIPVDRRHEIPNASDAGFADGLAALCARLGIDVLVPGVDEELPHMPAVAERAPALRILVPEPDYVTTMLDKLETVRALAGKGLDSPRTATIDEVEAVGFPCVAKPRWGRGSRGFHVLRGEGEADAYLRLSGLPRDQVVVQELLEGQEYTVMMAADGRGWLHVVVPVKVNLKRGVTIRAETEAAPAVAAACQAIHEALPARGCYNIQLMATDDGRVVPFEINPRISTTFCLGVSAGVDPVSIFLDHREAGGLCPFKAGVRLHRYWYNEFGNAGHES